jgi:hypothetical protein
MFAFLGSEKDIIGEIEIITPLFQARLSFYYEIKRG